ncbi:hypothetical protein [Streptomyces sp. SPB074]|uniref:hypothetical protein n=1 Tax=Streptomyces sp. (strain SPB074) TaxID=465543 RepID=UPI0005668AD6|nr:hypothetical protein [Streptomyces sp. SPB074]
MSRTDTPAAPSRTPAAPPRPPTPATAALLVVPFDTLTDLDNEVAAEETLREAVEDHPARIVVVRVRSRVVTPQALRILLRAGERTVPGGVLCVAAEYPAARRVFHLTGLVRALHVAATVPGAVRRARGGPVRPATPPRPRTPVRTPSALAGAARRARVPHGRGGTRPH